MAEAKDTMIRACLAALARRAGKTGLVLRRDEIDHDLQDDAIELVYDSNANCVRITATPVPAAALEPRE